MRRLITLVLFFAALPIATAWAQDRAVLLEQAPVYLRPDATRTPLRTLNRGAEVAVLREQGDWIQVEFRDPQFGTRAGFVESRFVRRLASATPPTAAPALQPRTPAADVINAEPAVASASSRERASFAKIGTYVAASGVPNFTLDGKTFNGSTWYKQVGGDEFGILPRLEPKSTVRAIVGYRVARNSFEVSYEQTNHQGTFQNLSGEEATFHSLNFDERTFFLTRWRVQPYGLIGLSMVWLTVKDGAFLHDEVGDANYRGWGANLEPGVMVFAHPRLGLGIGYRYRPMWFFRASGVSQNNYDLHPKFRETSGGVAFTGFFTF
jgi:hypothetical protein